MRRLILASCFCFLAGIACCQTHQQKNKIIYKGASDKEFDKGSTITTIDATPAITKDLALLGKMWGFLKYHHPAVRNGDYNWDYELFRILPKLLAAREQPKRDSVLLCWVKGLGEPQAAEQKKYSNKVAKVYPDLDWVTNSGLDTQLVDELTKIKNAKRDDASCYVNAHPVGNPDFTNEDAYETHHFPDAGFRLLCLYRYWNYIQYFFPYKNLIEENWNDVLENFIPRFISASDELEYKKTVIALIGSIHDSHADMQLPKDSVLSRFWKVNYAPLIITFIEQKVVVTDYYDTIQGKKTGVAIGDVIEKINNQPVEELVKDLLPYTPASNYTTQLRNMSYRLLRTNDSILFVAYDHQGQKNTASIACTTFEKLNISKKLTRTDTCLKFPASDIAYLYTGTLKNNYLPAIMSKVSTTKGLIIDLRCYPAEPIFYPLTAYLLPQPKPFFRAAACSRIYPGLFVSTPVSDAGYRNKNYYKGKVLILINENTQSMAEFCAMAFRTAPKAMVIGSTTAGADGDITAIVLPGGIKTSISGIGIYYPDGRGTQRVGIIPDLEIRPTIKGIAEGRDELLEKAIELINEK